MKRKMIAGILALALVATAFAVVSAQTNSGGPASMTAGGRPGGPWMNQLTEEERQEVLQQMQEFKQQICDQYNITCPSDPKFVDEDGDGINDNMRPHGWRYWRGPGFRWLAQTSTQEE